MNPIPFLAPAFFAYALRSTCGLPWALVILTFEGAIRIGMLLSLSITAWRALAKG